MFNFERPSSAYWPSVIIFLMFSFIFHLGDGCGHQLLDQATVSSSSPESAVWSNPLIALSIAFLPTSLLIFPSSSVSPISFQQFMLPLRFS